MGFVGLATETVFYLWNHIRVLLLFYVLWITSSDGNLLYTRLSKPPIDDIGETPRQYEPSCQRTSREIGLAALEEPMRCDGEHDDVQVPEQNDKQKEEHRVVQKAEPADSENEPGQQENDYKMERQKVHQSVSIAMWQKLAQHILRFNDEKMQRQKEDQQKEGGQGPEKTDLGGRVEEHQEEAERTAERHELGRQKLEEAEALLNSTTLKKRAGPNQRLKETFGIDNIFTTTDLAYYLAARANILNSLTESNKAHKRKAIRDAGVEGIRLALNGQETYKLLRIVRVLVMRSVMDVFFPSLPAWPDHDLDFVALRVNLLWYASKKRSLDLDATTTVREDLQGRLEAMFSTKAISSPAHVAYDRTNPRTNPLNIMLPAYLGLYRATLRCFIEVQYRSSPHNRTRWSSILCEYAESADQVMEDMSWDKQSGELSAVHLVSETLRLYPSTSHMWVGEDPTHEPAGADIEGIHRTHHVWGSSPLTFRPERWIQLGIHVSEEPAFLPFGRKRLSTGLHGHERRISMCPSRKTGGPRWIAILVACLLETIGNWQMSHSHEPDDVMRPGPLRKGVDAYESLRLRRPSPQRSGYAGSSSAFGWKTSLRSGAYEISGGSLLC